MRIKIVLERDSQEKIKQFVSVQVWFPYRYCTKVCYTLILSKLEPAFALRLKYAQICST